MNRMERGIVPEAGESFHIWHPSGSDDVALPMTFYLSRELVEDERFTDAALAELLHGDLQVAVEHHRKRLRASEETP